MMDFEQHFKDLAKEELDHLRNDCDNTKVKIPGLFSIAQRRYSFLNVIIRYLEGEKTNHFEKIVNLIGNVVEPLKDRLGLSVKELYVLLSSAYLHDLAKAYPELALADNLQRVEPLHLDQVLSIPEIRKIESAHPYVTFEILMYLIYPHHRQKIKIGHKSYPVETLWETHGIFKNLKDDDERFRLVSAIAYVCAAHKCLSFTDEDQMKERMFSFMKENFNRFLTQHGINTMDQALDHISGKEEIRIDLLVALLKLGDCFDICKDRIREHDFKEALEQYQEIEGILLKWLQFHITKCVEIDPQEKNIDIVVNYEIPRNLGRNNFLALRKEAEKDLEDQSFIKIIEYYTQPEKKNEYLLNRTAFEGFISEKYGEDKHTHIPIFICKYKLDIDKKEDTESIYVKKIKEISIKKQEHKSPIARFPLFKRNFPVKKFPKLVCYLPTSKHILYVLALFHRIKGTSLTVEQIGEKTGIKVNDVIICCDQLKRGGYIDKVSGMTPDAYIYSEDNRQIENLMERYEQDSYNIKTKTDEMELFGFPLPLENGTKDNAISSGITGLDQVLYLRKKGNREKKGIVPDKCILIKGAPGTGKTTFGMQLLWGNRGLSTLYFTFDEDLQQLEDDFSKFNWRDLREEINVIPLRFNRKNHDKKSIFQELAAILDERKPDLLVVDSINHLAEYVSSLKSKELLSDFISVLKIRHITSFFLAEETAGYSFEEYLVDGIIRLTLVGNRRDLEIAKLRGQNYIEGRHSYRILDANAARRENKNFRDEGPYNCGINVFPNITYYAEPTQGESQDKSKPTATSYGQASHHTPEIIPTGTEGLDDMLPSSREKGKQGGFLEGSAILLAGTPGSGKTIMGLQFLKKGREEPEEKRDTGPALWISFEACDEKDLKKSIATFDDKLGFKSLIEDKSYFYFKHFSPAKLNFDELVHVIAYHIDNYFIDKICIDSISDIVAQFETHPIQFKSNINSLCHYLTSKGVTTLFLYRMSQFFGEVERMGVEIISMVDTILAIKNLEVHNRVEKGMSVLKIRGREHLGDIRPVMIDSQNGLRIRDIGWSMENLISGQTGLIGEPFIFVKFFYENPAEDEIVEKAIDDFKSRYPGPTQFITKVRKPQIHIDYWSFGERRGPGHSNVKVFSISKSWAEAFLAQGRLHDLWEYIPKRIHEELKVIGDPFWRECRKRFPDKEEKYNYFFIPHYADIGVLTFRKDILEQFVRSNAGEIPREGFGDNKLIEEALKKAQIPTEHKQKVKIESEDFILITFDDIETLFEKVKEALGKSKHDDLKYAFAMPALSEVPSFVAFFMELVWAYGGNLFKFPDWIPDAATGEPKKKEDAEPGDFREYVKKVGGRRDELEQSIQQMQENAERLQGEEKNGFLSWFNKNEQELKKKTLDTLVVIDKEGAVDALKKLEEWCTKPICGNPYVGDYRRESLFSRQWYSRINTVYKGLFLSEEKIHEIEKEKENKEKKRERMREEILRQRKKKIGITFLPITEGIGKCCTGYDLVCVGLIKGSISPETGWLFIDALMTPENISMRSEYRLGLPARKEYYDREEFKTYDEDAFRIANKVRFENDSKIEIKYFGKIPYFAEIEGKIHKHLKGFFAKVAEDEKADPKATLSEMSKDIKDFIRKQIKQGR